MTRHRTLSWQPSQFEPTRQSTRQCFTQRGMCCANSGGLVGAGLGDFVLELVEDLDLEGPRVVGNSGLGVSVVSVAFSTSVFL